MSGIALVGLGRIGRLVAREGLQGPLPLPIQAVIDVADPVQLAALMDFDTNYGRARHPIRFEDGRFDFGDGVTVPFYHPEQVLYDTLDAPLVVEATGRGKNRAAAAAHLDRGARHVLVTMPPKTRADADAILLYGVNHEEFDPRAHAILSMASCTTNCLVHAVLALAQAGMKIRSGFFNAVHSVTNTQRLVDGPAEDLCDAWSGFQNIIVSETGAAKSIGMLFPDLDGALTGQAIRVPTGTVSLLEAHLRLAEPPALEEVRAAYRRYEAAHPEVLEVTSVPYLPSRAYLGNSHSCVVVAPTLAVLGDLVRVAAWYDNELSYARRVLDLCRYLMGVQ
jgi:glyceraldehyde 3-phosphate dehydrogenase (phosphorylating)